jgi:hypothetical protein
MLMEESMNATATHPLPCAMEPDPVALGLAIAMQGSAIEQARAMVAAAEWYDAMENTAAANALRAKAKTILEGAV